MDEAALESLNKNTVGNVTAFLITRIYPEKIQQLTTVL